MSDVVKHAMGGGSLLPSDAEIDRVFRLAKGLAMSGMFKDSQRAEQAFGKILLGQDLGLTPTQALTSIDLIDGKPEMSANLQAAKVRQYRSPEGARYDFRISSINDEGCRIEFSRIHADGSVDELGASEFTRKDAAAANLSRGPWKTYPRNMMFARALTNGVAWFVPEVTFGLRVYGVGEISDREPEQADVQEAIESAKPEAATEQVDGTAEEAGPEATLFGDAPAAAPAEGVSA